MRQVLQTCIQAAAASQRYMLTLILFFGGTIFLNVAAINKATAQSTGTHVYQPTGINTDLKGYSMCTVNKEDEFAMAGTIYHDPTDPTTNSIHYLHVDASGNVLDSKIIDLFGLDERAIDIDWIPNRGDDKLVITTLLRNTSGSGQDDIRLIFLDADGTVTSEKIINAGVGIPIPSSVVDTYKRMYPLNTIVNNDTLYIAGYVTSRATTFPNYPVWGPSGKTKRSFVIKYRIVPATATCRWYDYSFSGTGVSTLMDYDMATRVFMLNQGPNAGRLYITGSCNVVTRTPSQTSNQTHCATLSVIQDLNFNVAPAYQKPFSLYGLSETGDTGEVGIGIIENTYDGASDLFVVGNYFKYTNNAAANQEPYPDANFWITRVSINDLTFSNTILSRLTLKDVGDGGPSNAWAQSVIQPYAGSSLPTGVIAGLQSDAPADCLDLFPQPPSATHIEPFLHEISPAYDGAAGGAGITYSASYWSTIRSLRGTGPSASSNNFRNLGGGVFSNLVVLPPNAVRIQDLTQGIALNVGIWHNTDSKLNLKFVRLDKYAEDTSCDFFWKGCDLYDYNQELVVENGNGAVVATGVFNNGGVGTGGAFVITSPSSTVTDFDVTDTTCKMDGQAYRNGAGGNTTLSPANALMTDDGRVALYPNPATDFIYLVMPDDWQLDGTLNINVSIMDINGRIVSNLYSGSAMQLNNNRIKLPELSAGIYSVLIGSSLPNSKTYSIKLSIQ